MRRSERQTGCLTTSCALRSTASAGPRFTYGETKFDDGWVARDEADWVRATRGPLTVLVHFASPDLRPYNDVDKATAAVWDQLVAPRYTAGANLWFRRGWYADGDPLHGKYFASGDLTRGDVTEHVALFKDGNAGKWVEIHAPSKAVFERELTKVVPQDGTRWAALSVLANVNQFGVAAADLVGSWGSASGASIDHVNIYTGNRAGTAYVSAN